MTLFRWSVSNKSAENEHINNITKYINACPYAWNVLQLNLLLMRMTCMEYRAYRHWFPPCIARVRLHKYGRTHSKLRFRVGTNQYRSYGRAELVNLNPSRLSVNYLWLAAICPIENKPFPTGWGLPTAIQRFGLYYPFLSIVFFSSAYAQTRVYKKSKGKQLNSYFSLKTSTLHRIEMVPRTNYALVWSIVSITNVTLYWKFNRGHGISI